MPRIAYQGRSEYRESKHSLIESLLLEVDFIVAKIYELVGPQEVGKHKSGAKGKDNCWARANINLLIISAELLFSECHPSLPGQKF